MIHHYYLPNPVTTNMLCFPESMGHYKQQNNHHVYRAEGQLKHYNLHIVCGGKGFIKRENQIFELGENTGFLYGPGLVQEYWADLHVPWDLRWIHFLGNGLDRLFEGRGRGDVWLFALRSSSRIKELTDEMMSVARSYQTKDETRLSALLYECLLELKFHGESFPILKRGNTVDRIHLTADHIRDQCSDSLTLQQMAQWCGYSAAHFSRLFSQVMGRSPIEHLIECRVMKSKSMLTGSSLSIKQIARECGFRESGYFIKCFKLREQMTPVQYRQLNMK